MEDTQSIIRDAAALAVSAAKPEFPGQRTGSTPYVVVPDNFAVVSLDHLYPEPLRKKARVTLSDAKSFISYCKLHGHDDITTIYVHADLDKLAVTMHAILNDNAHEVPVAGWRDHVATFSPRVSVEWSRWTKRDKAKMTQVDFASWLEDTLPDIRSVKDETTGKASPSGSEMLDMALAFEANADKRFRSKTNLQDGGISLEFVDEANAQTRSAMKVFERFTLGIPVFDGSKSAYPIQARLKYSIDASGKLLFWYELIRTDRVFKSAVEDTVKEVAEGTGYVMVAGHPGD